MTATGVTDAKNLLLGNERTVYERTGISQDKIIHAVWEAEGYAQPGWLLVQDDEAEILKSQLVTLYGKHTSALTFGELDQTQ